jgi:beta-mannanase
MAYGVNWKYVEGRSDIKEVTGDYPAVFGWDLSHLELDQKVNIDSVPFANMKRYIQQGYRAGSVITISWHGTNPLTGKSAWDNTPGTVASILPGGAKHESFKTQLDKIADFLLGITGPHGETIPIIFRPFHELTGNWFWWGVSSCTADEYKSIYRFTVNYLRDVKKVHSLLTVYNTGSNFNSADSYLERYPGDDVVDILSFDDYQSGGPENGASFIKNANTHLTIIEDLAFQKNKVPVFAECGYNQVPDSVWWTNTLLKAIGIHHPAYVLVWRNAGYKAKNIIEYYAPYPTQPSAPDFIKFYQSPLTLFQRDAAIEKMYK